MRLSVIIPAFNEERRLPHFLRVALPWLHEHYQGSYEIIVVDDGSTDRTAEVAAQMLSASKVIRFSTNRGKGAAVRTGMLAAQGRLRLFADADGATPIAELLRLLQAIDGGADIAIGSRAARGGQLHWAKARTEATLASSAPPEWNVRWYRHLSGRIFSLLVRKMTGLSFRDTQCGFKLFRAEAAEKIFRHMVIDRFGFDVEALYLASKLQLKIAEIAVHWHEIDGSKVRVGRDAWRMLQEVWRIKRVHREPLSLENTAKEKRRA